MDVLPEGSKAGAQDNARQTLANEAQSLLDCAKASSPEFKHELGWGAIQVGGGGSTMALGLAALALNKNPLPLLWGLGLAGDGVRRGAAAITGDKNVCSANLSSSTALGIAPEGIQGEASANRDLANAVANKSLEELPIFDNVVQNGKPSDTDGLVKHDPGLALMRQMKPKDENGSIKGLPTFDNAALH